MGYVLSRPGYKLNGLFSTIVFIPMIFSGGMVASYVVIAQMLNLRDTIWSLILPLCVSSFNVTICRTYFRTNIPDAVIESAKIDGASQLTIFARIVVPISKPLLATIGLFLAFGYWNDWFQSSLYISDDNLLSLQALLNQLQKNMEFLTKNPTGRYVPAGLPPGDADGVCANGNSDNNRGADRVCVSVLPEVLHLRPYGRGGERLILSY